MYLFVIGCKVFFCFRIKTCKIRAGADNAAKIQANGSKKSRSLRGHWFPHRSLSEISGEYRVARLPSAVARSPPACDQGQKGQRYLLPGAASVSHSVRSTVGKGRYYGTMALLILHSLHYMPPRGQLPCIPEYHICISRPRRILICVATVLS